MPATDPARTAIRREMRRRRRQLSKAARRESSRALAANLFSLSRIRHARSIAAYLPVQGEISAEPALARAFELGTPVFLPCLRGGKLEFRRYRHGDPLRDNRFGIPEPLPGADRINPRFLDIVLAPLVAFDETGARLGTGGGYYDRTFAFLRMRQSWHRPSLIGVAYEFQRVDALPFAEWDVPLQGVVTDVSSRFFPTRRS